MLVRRLWWSAAWIGAGLASGSALLRGQTNPETPTPLPCAAHIRPEALLPDLLADAGDYTSELVHDAQWQLAAANASARDADRSRQWCEPAAFGAVALVEPAYCPRSRAAVEDVNAGASAVRPARNAGPKSPSPANPFVTRSSSAIRG